MSKHFNFNYTCPDIDKAIEGVKKELLDAAGEMAEDICPYIEGEALARVKKYWGGTMFDRIQNHIEDVRSTNMDMRTSAESQLRDLQEEIDDLKYELQQVKNELAEAQTE